MGNAFNLLPVFGIGHHMVDGQHDADGFAYAMVVMRMHEG